MKTAAVLDDSERKKRGEILGDPEEDGAEASGAADGWETPIPFGEPHVPPFPLHRLPSPTREYVEAVAEATQVSVEMPAALVLAAVAACIQRRVVVEVKPGYQEPTSLYIAVVSEPGTRKSAVLSAITKPIEAWEREEGARLGPGIERAKAERSVKEKRKLKLEEEASKAKDPNVAKDKTEEAAQIAAELTTSLVLTYPRILADDVTPEQLARLMAEQGERLAIFSAEGGIFETMAGRYAKGIPNLDVFLKGHSGDAVRVDRRVGPPVMMSCPALTMGLAVQPEVLRQLADKPGFRGRGLLARYLFVLPPKMLGRRKVDVAAVPANVTSAYRDCIRRLLATESAVDNSPVRLTLSGDASAAWLSFSARLEPRLGVGGDLGHFGDWAGKAAGAAARLAGLLHAVGCAASGRNVAGAVDRESMVAAIELVESFFISHALAAFAEMGVDQEMAAAQALVEWLSARGMEEISIRDAHSGLQGQVRFRRVAAIESAFELAARYGHVRRLPDPPRSGPGRPPAARYGVLTGRRTHGKNPQNPQNGGAR